MADDLAPSEEELLALEAALESEEWWVDEYSYMWEGTPNPYYSSDPGIGHFTAGQHYDELWVDQDEDGEYYGILTDSLGEAVDISSPYENINDAMEWCERQDIKKVNSQ